MKRNGKIFRQDNRKCPREVLINEQTGIYESAGNALSDISQAERDEALQYYNDYLDDAGIENEESAIRALGSPIQVAANIKEGLKEGNEAGEFMENGFHMNNEEKDMMILPGEASSEDDKAAGRNQVCRRKYGWCV